MKNKMQSYSRRMVPLFPSSVLISGVDYLKYDNCGRGPPEWQPRYDRMRDGLLKYWDQPILYALCEWGEDKVWRWGNETGHSWRISEDIWPYYPLEQLTSEHGIG
jgi:alpha-galactosidase